MCGGRPPVHRDGPSAALRGRGDGGLHAQDHRGHLRGGPPAAETHGAEAPLRARLQADDRGPDEHGQEGLNGTVRHREQRVTSGH